jgi:peroxiredoxin Q/BCP
MGMKAAMLMSVLALLAQDKSFGSALWGLAQDKPAVDLKVGDAAPKFEAPDDAGKAWKSDEHVGKKIVVVYFFPAAFTGG